MESNICFVCLSSADNSFHDEYDSSLYLKFCKLSKVHLGIPSSVLNCGPSWRPAFCATCEPVVNSICGLHQQLVNVQLRLSSKLGELAELLENSQPDEKWTSSHVSIINSLSKQLGVKFPAVADTFRSYLKKKCKTESYKSLPLVVVERMEDGQDIGSKLGVKQDLDEDDDTFLEPDDLPFATEIPKCHGEDNSSTRSFEVEADAIKEEVIGAKNIIMTEHLDKATLSQFIDEGEDEEDDDDDSKEVPRNTTHVGGRFFCSACNTSFTTKQSLHHHMDRIHNPQPHVCPHCQEVYTAARNLRAHILRIHPDFAKVKKFRQRCPKCGEPFLTRFHWKTHVSTCGASQRVAKIQTKTDNNKGNRKISVYAVKPTPFVKTEVLTQEEQRSVEEVEKEQFPCKICGKVFYSQRSIYQHRVTVHSKKQIKCPVCSHLLKTKANFLRHLNTVHESQSFDCTECKKVFTTAKYFAEHVTSKHPS